MEFVVCEKPCLLLETAELLYAHVNRITADQLTCAASYTIPEEDVARIQAEVCAGIDPEDAEWANYFRGVLVDSKTGRMSCLAFALLYAYMPVEYFEVDEAADALKREWQEQEKPFSVTGISSYSLSTASTEEYTTLAREIGKLAIPQSYQLQLVEAFSTFEAQVDRLAQLLGPLAEQLKPLLEPWVCRAKPLREAWRSFFTREDAITLLFRRCNLAERNLDSAVLTMRYFSPEAGAGRIRCMSDALYLHLGVSNHPDEELQESATAPRPGEYTALRLLTRQECVDIFRTTREKPKCIQDLAQELNMNPGTVFRNVNSMFNVGLLKLEIISGRNYYWANIPRMERITEHLVRYLKEI